MIGRTIGAAALGLALLAGAAGAAEGELKYVGVSGCKTCHKKELIGDQYGKWREAPHSRAFETLKSPKALEIATAKGLAGPPSEAAECLKCHATAHGLDPSRLAKKPLANADGVQCESCHGPGSAYRKKKTMADHQKSLAAGLWEPGKDQKICAGCHNAESPTWDAAKGFDYAAAKGKIAHPIPEDVKGRYLEVVKERRAAGGSADEEDEEE